MVGERLEGVLARVAAAADRSGRDPGDVTLVAVSKGHSVASIAAAYEAGHRDFGENRAQELVEKAPQLPGDIRWHFVGGLQTRKTRQVRPFVHLLHSLDREKLIRSWAAEPDPPPALIQVNIGGERQKHGAAPDDVPGLAELAIDAGIRCRGVMVIPPAPGVAEDSRHWFSELATMAAGWRRRLPDLTELSMGMTDDYEVAIEEGATVIRIGRAIFGDRSAGFQAGERGA